MKITHILSAPAAGGAEVYVKDLSKCMTDAGHEVFLLFLNHASDVGRDPGYERDFLSELERAGVRHGFIGRAARRNPFVGLRRVWKHVRSWEPDVIHAHLYYGAVFAWFYSVPLIYTHHNIRLSVPRIFYRWFLDRRVVAYVGICQACADLLSKVSDQRVVRIDNAVSASRIHRRALPRMRRIGPVRVVAVGMLSRQKNYSLLLNACASNKDLAFELSIAGEGPKRESLELEAAALGITDRVKLLGNVSDVSALLASADLYVLSSSWEGLPIALLEATLAGLPVLVTDVGGCREVVEEVGNGLVVAPDSVPEFANSLRLLLTSDDFRASLSGAAVLNSTRYRLDTAVASHLALYDDVLRCRPRL